MKNYITSLINHEIFISLRSPDQQVYRVIQFVLKETKKPKFQEDEFVDMYINTLDRAEKIPEAERLGKSYMA